MPNFDLGIIGWIIIGFLAGALSGLVVRDRTPGGCLANILIGILGGSSVASWPPDLWNQRDLRLDRRPRGRVRRRRHRTLAARPGRPAPLVEASATPPNSHARAPLLPVSG